MKIVITGGLGFIGLPITTELMAQGFEVIAIDNLSNTSINFNSDKHKFFKANILEDNLSHVLKDTEVLIHLAAMHYIPECEARPFECLRTNVFGSLNLIEQAKKYHVKKIIFASSAAVYKPSMKPHLESDETVPIDIYGRSKIIVEELLKDLRGEMELTILRLFNVVGPGDRTKHFIPQVLEQLRKNTSSVEVGNIDSVRDYIDVRDIVNAVTTLVRENIGGGIINLGSGVGTSGREILKILINKIERGIKIQSVAHKLRVLDRPNLVANIDRYIEVFGGPKYSIDNSLAYLVESFK